MHCDKSIYRGAPLLKMVMKSLHKTFPMKERQWEKYKKIANILYSYLSNVSRRNLLFRAWNNWNSGARWHSCQSAFIRLSGILYYLPQYSPLSLSLSLSLYLSISLHHFSIGFSSLSGPSRNGSYFNVKWTRDRNMCRNAWGLDERYPFSL